MTLPADPGLAERVPDQRDWRYLFHNFCRRVGG
jgi:hypothetical protein